jgi:hypothetical protein
MPHRFACPHCDTLLKLSDALSSPMKIRCPRCDAVFPLPTEDEVEREDRPAQRRQLRARPATLVMTLVAVGLGSLVLVGIAVVAGLSWLRQGTPVAQTQPAPRLPPPGRQSPTAGQGQVGTEVGMTAREIEGEDIDGKPFKLSDYRGKVVLLDFWGHW